MHIPDGTLPAGVCVAGYAVSGAALWFSMRKINQKEDPREGIPRASLLTATFFAASLVHIPVPPTSVHLVLNGLLGVILGYYAFPAILIGLLFQCVMFQHGGLTTLGVNAAVMGAPALLAFYLFRLRRFFDPGNRAALAVLAAVAGGGALGVSALTAFVILVNNIPAYISAEAERASIYTLMIAHIPLIFIEGIFTALVVLFLHRVKAEMLEN